MFVHRSLRRAVEFAETFQKHPRTPLRMNEKKITREMGRGNWFECWVCGKNKRLTWIEMLNHEIGCKNIEVRKIVASTDRYMGAWIETSCKANGIRRLRTFSTRSKLENFVSKEMRVRKFVWEKGNESNQSVVLWIECERLSEVESGCASCFSWRKS